MSALLRLRARFLQRFRTDTTRYCRVRYGWEQAPQSPPMRMMRLLLGSYLEVPCNGRRMIVDLRDTVVSQAIVYEQTWEPEKTKLFRRLIAPGDNIVDIGAHIGYYAVLFGQAVRGSGRVVSIEPDDDNARLLRENIALNDLSGTVSVVQAAAGRAAGFLDLYSKRSVANRGDHRTWDDGGAGVKKTRIPVVAVDDLTAAWQHTDVIKMDIQGSEYFALQGMKRTLTDNHSIAVVTEFWPAAMSKAGADPRTFLAEFAGMGFALWRIGAQSETVSMSPEDLLGTLGGEESSADLLFMRPSYAAQRLEGLAA